MSYYAVARLICYTAGSLRAAMEACVREHDEAEDRDVAEFYRTVLWELTSNAERFV